MGSSLGDNTFRRPGAREKLNTSPGAVKLQKEELTQEIRRFLEALLQQAGLNLQFQCLEEDSVINVELQGEDVGLVLTNNARVLYAINHLLNQAFYRRSSEACSFVVDCDDYRAVRERELQVLAQKAADTVRRSGSAFSLQPMPAGERRVVHLALAEESGVRTESEGAGLHRHVVIFPLP